MTATRPVLVALPLDHEAPDIVAAAARLTRVLGTPAVVVHVLPVRRREPGRSLDERVAEARAQLEPHVATLRAAGVDVSDVLVPVGAAGEVVVMTATRLAAQMIVTGGGRPATVRRWVVGSVAESVVRRASVPVWVARGELPSGRPVLCPVDASETSQVGLDAAIRMARLLELPLSVLTVAHNPTMHDVAAREEAALSEAQAMLDASEVEGLAVSVSARTGHPADEILDAADDAGLLVVASRGYDPLVREWLGPVTTRALRHSQCNVLLIRDVGEGHEQRVRAITELADLFQRARELLLDDRGEEALPILHALAERAPSSAAVQEAYAQALERVGLEVEAASRRELAGLIRARLT